MGWLGESQRDVAVAPISMSPYPAGRAKTAGRMPRASARTKMKPISLQDCAKVNALGFNDSKNCRKPADAAYQAAKMTSGNDAASATPTPKRSVRPVFVSST